MWYPKYSELVPPGQTVNSGFYCDILQHLRENVQTRCPELWQEQTWLLHHDNVPSHTSALTLQFLDEIQNGCHPPPTVLP
jgi:hypothetical protein